MQTPIDDVFVGGAATTVAGFLEIARRTVNGRSETPLSSGSAVAP